ncbi:MAG: tRNA pseudouridine(38-40) synthase TruA [Candidatus Dormibacteria bacterium]
MSTYRVTLEYDGTAYSGWQWQPSVATVEGAVRGALERLTGERPQLSAAGRTDAGAHAHGQVIGLTLQRSWAADRLRLGLDAQLPRDITARAVAVAPPSFHARFDAVDRTYRYLVTARRSRPAVTRKYVWSVSGPLDVSAMCAAARLLKGRHDFAGFGRAPRLNGSTVRTIHQVRVRRLHSMQPDAADVLLIDVRADAFLYGMMRTIAGALVSVGEGKLTEDQVATLLSNPAEVGRPIVAPAHGLHQWSVSYPAAAIAQPDSTENP